MSQALSILLKLEAKDSASIPVNKTKESLKSLSKTVDQSSSAMTRLDNAMGSFSHWVIGVGALGAAFSSIPGRIYDAVSAMEQLNLRLKNATDGADGFAKTKEYLIEASGRLSINMGVLTQGFIDLKQIQDQGVISGGQTISILEGLSNAAAATGASTAQVEQVMYGLSQALSAGTVRAEELNQITEPMTGLLNRIGEAAGMTGGQFREMVNAGQISSEMFAQTLIPALESYGNVSEQKAQTIEGAMVRLENAWLAAGDTLATPINQVSVAALDSISGAVSDVASVLGDLTQNWDEFSEDLADAATLAAMVAIVGNYRLIASTADRATASVLAYAVAQLRVAKTAGTAAIAVRGLNTALAFLSRNPLGLAITTLAAGYLTMSGNSDTAAAAAQELNEKLAEQNIQLNNNVLLKRAKELDEYRTKLERLIEQKRQNSAIDVFDVREDALRHAIARLESGRSAVVELSKSTETLVDLQKEFDAQVKVNTTTLADFADMLSFIAQTENDWRVEEKTEALKRQADAQKELLDLQRQANAVKFGENYAAEIEEITKLQKLRSKGLISNDEFGDASFNVTANALGFDNLPEVPSTLSQTVTVDSMLKEQSGEFGGIESVWSDEQSRAENQISVLDSLYATKLEKERMFQEERLSMVNNALDQGVISEQRAADLKSKINEQYRDSQISTASEGFGIVAQLMSVNNEKMFKIGKAAAIAQAMISTYQGAAKALELGPIIGPIAAAAQVALGLAQVSQIKSQQFTPSAAGGYDIPAGVNPVTQLHEKEMVLPAKHAEVIRNMADGGSSGGVEVHIHNAPAGADVQQTGNRIDITFLKDQISNAIAGEMMAGTSPLNPALEYTYGVAR